MQEQPLSGVQSDACIRDRRGPMNGFRICSLLPSATEIVCALGLEGRLVAVTHECDYPPSILHLPRVTASTIDSTFLSAAEIDRAVRDNLTQQATIYHLDRDLLESLQPDLVLTQSLCDVCAVGPDEVRTVLASLSHIPEVMSLEPTCLDQVFNSILAVGMRTNAQARSESVVSELRLRLAAVRTALQGVVPVRVLTVEWIDPVFVGGHWVPEMVEAAGGQHVLGERGKPSRQVAWSDIVSSAPDIVVFMPCGFDLARAVKDARSACRVEPWNQLEAVQQGRVYATDGGAYFSRPGPRLIDGVEILAALFHPNAFCRGPHGASAPLQPTEASIL